MSKSPEYWLGAKVQVESYWDRGYGTIGTIIGTEYRNGIVLFDILLDGGDDHESHGVTVPRSEFWLAW